MSTLVAAFQDEAGLIGAAKRLRALDLEAYTPYPVEALDTLLPRSSAALPVIVFLGIVVGLALGFGMQWYAAAVGYPINVGGRPLASWPAFIPIAFEIAVLCGVLAGFFGFFVLARLPQPHQPVVTIEGFERATRDRFFLLIDGVPDRLDLARIRALLEDFAPCSVEPWQR